MGQAASLEEHRGPLRRKGQPFLMFEGAMYDEVSISHERSFAVAVVRVEAP